MVSNMNNGCYMIFITSNLNATEVAYLKKIFPAKIADEDCWKNTINFSPKNQGKTQYYMVN